MSYKKVKTVLVYGKKKCIYMKPKGTREYVKSKRKFVVNLPISWRKKEMRRGVCFFLSIVSRRSMLGKGFLLSLRT